MSRAETELKGTSAPIFGRLSSLHLEGIGSMEGRHTQFLGDQLDSFRLLATRLREAAPGQLPRCVVVTGFGPAAFPITVGVGLASAGAVAGTSTIVVDCGLARPALAEFLGLDASPGLREYLCAEAAPRSVLQSVALEGSSVAHRTGPEGGTPGRIVCISAGRQSATGLNLLETLRFENLVGKLTRAYQQTVLVLPTQPPPDLAGSLSGLADRVVVCADSSKSVVAGWDAAMACLQRRPGTSGIVLIDP